MSFDAEWLSLRAPADLRARNRDVLDAFTSSLAQFDAPHVLDLGCGTGATFNALSPHLPAGTRWTLVDNDPALLARATNECNGVTTQQADLAANVETVLKTRCDAVTASALLDLVSTDWIERLVGALDGRAIYAALNYDGNEDWQPADAADEQIERAFQRHQRGDKGFGPALGPVAASTLAAKLEAAGYDVIVGSAPWRLEAPRDRALMNALAAGIAGAAVETGLDTEVVDGWLARRDAANSCTVGHMDVVGLPKR